MTKTCDTVLWACGRYIKHGMAADGPSMVAPILLYATSANLGPVMIGAITTSSGGHEWYPTPNVHSLIDNDVVLAEWNWMQMSRFH